MKYILPVVLLPLLIACSSNIDTTSDYKSWFSKPSNGFVKTRQVGRVQFRVQRRPPEYMALREITEITNINLKDSVINTYEGSLYFMMDITWLDQEQEENQPLRGMVSTYEEYQSVLKQLSFNLGENLYLKAGEKEIAPSLTHFEPGYELAKSNRIMIAFPMEEEYTEAKLVFNDRFFGTGIQKFSFDLTTAYPPLPKTL